LVPHIFRDYEVIKDLFDQIADPIRRSAVSVAPYLLGDRGQSYIFDLYRQVDLVVGMRFHANVCAIGLNKPCVGLVTYRQISDFYEELNLTDFSVEVNKSGFLEQLIEKSDAQLDGTMQRPDTILPYWKQQLKTFHLAVKDWLVELKVV